MSPTTPELGRNIDVSALPTHALRARSLIWWGAVLLVCIESTMMGLLLVSYFYLRGNFQVWPPSGVGDRAFRLASVQALLLFASAAPMGLCVRAARRQQLRLMRTTFVVGTLLAAALLVLRGFEMQALPFRWDANAYGSMFWLILGLHTMHVGTGVIENAVLAALLFVGPVEKKHFPDVEASVVLWWLLVLEWIPGFAILYLEPIFLPR